MSEAAYADVEAPSETEETGVDETEANDETGNPEGDEGDEPEARQRKAQDWEKIAHNREGQAARERSRRRAAERRSAELEARLERLEAQGRGPERDELLELIGGLSDDEDDPVGDIAQVKKALKAFRSRQLQEAEEDGRRSTADRQLRVLETSMAESEADFALDHPDYHEAAAHYRKQRIEELEDAGYAGASLQRKLAEDLYGVVRMAIQNGLDPAERVYALAKRRGFKAGASEAGKKIDVLKRASAAGVTANGKGATSNVLSWEDVAKLDGAARDKAWAKLRERERGRR